MTLNVYLRFNGNCREALEYYRTVFQSDYQAFLTFGESPEDLIFSEANDSEIMHASIPVGNSVLMGSDTGTDENSAIVGNNFSVSYVADSKERTDEIFSKLAVDGEITMPLQETFWGSYFGSCTDQFGINWMVSYELPQNSA